MTVTTFVLGKLAGSVFPFPKARRHKCFFIKAVHVQMLLLVHFEAGETKFQLTVLYVMQPRPTMEPLVLEGPLLCTCLSKFALRELESLQQLVGFSLTFGKWS